MSRLQGQSAVYGAEGGVRIQTKGNHHGLDTLMVPIAVRRHLREPGIGVKHNLTLQRLNDAPLGLLYVHIGLFFVFRAIEIKPCPFVLSIEHKPFR